LVKSENVKVLISEICFCIGLFFLNMLILVPNLSVFETKIYGWLVGYFFLLTIVIELFFVMLAAIRSVMKKESSG